VLLDATVVRMVLVPATMALLGNANWWLPGWLDRLLPHLDLEGGAELEPEPVTVDAQRDRDPDGGELEPAPAGAGAG
jgi:putative drug exporter of the RND superfamily